MVEPTTMAAIASAIGQYGQAKINQNSQNSAMKGSAKKQFLYNLYLQQQQQAWEKERALNAHQWEMQDLKAAGLNPALTATGGSGANTGGIGLPTSGMADMQGLNMGNFTDMIQQLVDMKNNTKATNASSNLADAQALKTLTENKYIPQNIKNETMNAISNRITANANATNATTNQQNSNAGMWQRIIGGKSGQEFTNDMRRHVRRQEGDWFHFELRKKSH